MKHTLLLTLCLAAATATFAQENSQWRGHNRDGIYNDAGLLKVWADAGPQLLWSYSGLGEGYTATAIANGKIYITGMTDSIGYLYILDLQGNLLNKKPYGLEWNTNYNGSRSTVNVNDGHLYIFTGRGILLCLDEKTLETVWSKNFLTDFDGTNLKFGMTESPLIVGDVIYATPGGKKNNLVALNKKTGNLIWTSAGSGRPSTYCSPQYVGDLEIPLIVNAIDSSLVAFNARTGEMLWAVDQKNPYGMSPNTPIYADGKLFSTTGGGIGSMLLRLTDGGKNVEKIWSNEMDNKMGGAVKVGNYIYGSGEKNRYWYCIDWNTGETRFKDNKIGVGDIISADGMLYCYSDKGELALVKATPEKFDLISRFKITLGTNQHWAHPVIHKGVLYLRHGDALMAYKIN
ncbi:MAG: PQQ-binding-like beta-propeller repeat protein [Prevotellaceae bacterium]|jgi:outer membrane protein assembly factor BamB|nr:PQQ-binding-like beta-propeller repeat protein [Prevotellaceae bacterium]